MDEFYELFFSQVSASEYGDIVDRGMESYNHDNWRDFPFYSRNDTKFRFIRDSVLGGESYTIMMSNMMQNYGVNENALSEGLLMSKSNIESLNDKCHLIGLHSHTHPTKLESLPLSEQKREYSLNFNCLKDIVKKGIRTMSHPCNSYNKDTLKILSNLGITMGFRSNMSDCHHSAYEFPREDHVNILKRIDPTL